MPYFQGTIKCTGIVFDSFKSAFFAMDLLRINECVFNMAGAA
jgi:hypothetical protein